ncbi:unnamed protein product, partial [Symbiodinium necroappetens]
SNREESTVSTAFERDCKSEIPRCSKAPVRVGDDQDGTRSRLGGGGGAGGR